MTSSKTVPTFSAAAIEQVCRVLAETVTGAQIPNLIQPLKVHEEATARFDTKWKRLFNAVVAAQNRQQDGRPLLRLVIEIMAPVRYQSQAELNMARTRLNASLLLSGFQVAEDGSLEHVRSAKTIEEAQQRAGDLHGELAHRDVHPGILAFCRAELLQENYFHAVLEACKSVADKVRNLTGLEDDGSPLVDATCSLSSGPRIAFNALSTEWERSEQAGLAMLMKGMFSTFRNPTAHAPKVRWATSRKDALDMMTLASMLHRRLDEAEIR